MSEIGVINQFDNDLITIKKDNLYEITEKILSIKLNGLDKEDILKMGTVVAKLNLIFEELTKGTSFMSNPEIEKLKALSNSTNLMMSLIPEFANLLQSGSNHTHLSTGLYNGPQAPNPNVEKGKISELKVIKNNTSMLTAVVVIIVLLLLISLIYKYLS